jgi:hypothetical protein
MYLESCSVIEEEKNEEDIFFINVLRELLLQLDTACSTHFVGFMLCITHKCTNCLLQIIYLIKLQHVSIHKIFIIYDVI